MAFAADVARKRFVSHHPVIGLVAGPSCVEALDMQRRHVTPCMLRNSKTNRTPVGTAMRAGVWLLCVVALAGTALAQSAPEIPRFSTGQAGAPPAGWEHIPLSHSKKLTEYSTVTDDGVVVLKANSRSAASLMGVRTDFDPHAFPMLSWRWKVTQGIAGAETQNRAREDAPVRLMVSFSGDMRKLGPFDRAASAVAESISGQPLPYAELMYVWGGKVAIDSITTSSLTARIRMLAVAADEQGLARWQTYTRNLVEDYRRAFGEDPGRITAIQLMTDTDNTGGIAEAFYGDISVAPAAH
jgi:Protein of unknown function (DUF3047)